MFVAVLLEIKDKNNVFTSSCNFLNRKKYQSSRSKIPTHRLLPIPIKTQFEKQNQFKNKALTKL